MKAPIRTITLGVEDAHPLSAERVKSAALALHRVRASYMAHGYEVQTLRISTRPIFADLPDWPEDALLRYAEEIQYSAESAGIHFFSLGTAQSHVPAERMRIIPDLLVPNPNLSATIQIATKEDGIRPEAVSASAYAIKRLSDETPLSFGNFQFAALANVTAGFPFFPAAYHSGKTTLGIGIQGAGIIAEIARPGLSPYAITDRARTAAADHAYPIVKIAADSATDMGIAFSGIDLSPAPQGATSIGAAIESFGLGHVGSPGTLTVIGALTAAIKDTGLPTCGYNGIMLPVLEDDVLGRRWSDGELDIHKLLCYSAVCGTGLDMIPLPGTTSQAQIEQLLFDVATLGGRLNKPLSARLMPIAGVNDGEITSFTSPYLINTLVRNVT
jgi:hypothetical protein